MRLKTKIITNIFDASACALKWLELAKGKKHSDWNNDRLAYVSNVLLESLHKYNWINQIEQVSQFYTKNDTSIENMAKLVNFINVKHNHGKQCNSLIFQNISLLLIHLSFERHIELRFGHQIKLPSNNKTFQWFYERGLLVSSVAHTYIASTPSRFNFFRSALPEKYRDFLDAMGDTHRSTRQRVGMNFLEAITYSHIKSMKDVTVQTLATYYKANSEASAYYIANEDKENKTSTVIFSLYMDLLDSAHGTTIRKDYEQLMSSGKLSLPHKKLTSVKEKNFIKTLSTGSQIEKMTCNSLNVNNYQIDTLVREVNVLSFGDFTFSVRESLKDFRPENLIVDNYWKHTQLDYVASGTESGTKKTRKSRLAYLNSYLFDYLPVFFKMHPNSCFKYPNDPSEFLSYVFISPSSTFSAAHFNNQKSIIFPISLLDYIYTITDEKAFNQGYSKTNGGRDAILTIQKYFEFVMSKFSGIPQCKLEVNPITHFDKKGNKGYRYSKSVKEKIELDYWVLLRLYLVEISKAMLTNAEDVVFKNKENKITFHINKSISWDGHKVHIDTFDASDIPMFSFSDWKEPTKVTEFQGVLTLTLLAWSGLRDSNVNWLDVRDYAKFCPSEYSDDDYLELWVNTDKARKEPYTSHISGKIMRLLDRSAKLRAQVNRNGFNDPIPYKGENSSKWPNIKPLLQKTKTNQSVFGQNFLVKIINEFEACLIKHNEKMTSEGRSPIHFNSSMYSLPLYANQKNFRNTKNYVHVEMDYTANLRNKATGETNKFTPIKKAVIWSPHSLRVNFDSVCSVLADPETVGQISTGQSAETVGYYTKNTPEEVARIKKIKCTGKLSKHFPPKITEERWNIASINDSCIDEREFLKKHAIGTAANDFGCYSMSAIHIKGFRSPIETIALACANDIAFNRTHICPFNNECPTEVISGLRGEKCCAICPYAIICPPHAIAISAELKRLGDIATDITMQLKSKQSLLTSEKEQLKKDRQLIIKSISGWLVRHKFLSKKINSGSFFTGKKNSLLLKHISKTSSGMNIIDRLIETDGISTMTSKKLENEAGRLNRKLVALMNKKPDVLETIERNSNTESEIALQLIKTICWTNQIDEKQLEIKLSTSLPITYSATWANSL